MSADRRPTGGLPRLLEWDAAGRALRQLDPDRYRQLLDLAQQIADLNEGRYVAPPSAADMEPVAEVSSSDERAQRRRRAFKVLDGGLSKTMQRRRARLDHLEVGRRSSSGDAA